VQPTRIGHPTWELIAAAAVRFGSSQFYINIIILPKSFLLSPKAVAFAELNTNTTNFQLPAPQTAAHFSLLTTCNWKHWQFKFNWQPVTYTYNIQHTTHNIQHMHPTYFSVSVSVSVRVRVRV
jgi:hypothetical protein